MDILSPELVWIENRCYRVNSTLESREISQSTKQGGYIEADLESEEELEPMDYDIQKTGETSFSSSFHVPAAFHGGIIGQKGATRKRLEKETRCLIQVPSRGSQAPIVVTGQREEDVVVARRKIDDVVASARRRNDFTHFLSIRCCTDEIKKAFARFQEAVKSGSPVDGLTDDMFQIPEKLHLTITIMILMDDQERKMVKELLHGEKDAIMAILSDFGGKAEIKIEGLDIMNDDPEATTVLHAKVHSEALQCIADYLEAVFGRKRLSRQKTRDHVKLHMTLVNSRFATKDQEGPKKFVPFNATNILQELKDFSFGTIPLTEIHLSQRSAYDDTGFYKATTTLSF
uniref:Putative transcription coactivator complex n=1 Tax=Phlebotomus kandelakii TaxID=1109342 RepID=A0A6B2EGG3_9DIPT